MVPSSPRLFYFNAGESGSWQIHSNTNLIGRPLPDATKLDVLPGLKKSSNPASGWQLQGITSNDRYVTRDEKTALIGRQPGLGRPLATHAALIAISKNQSWWDLTQDERRIVLEEKSQHIAIGMKYLPAVARRLYHCRDLSTAQPFDFITWFEFSEADSTAFDDLLNSLRTSVEWQFVDREVDIRITRAIHS